MTEEAVGVPTSGMTPTVVGPTNTTPSINIYTHTAPPREVNGGSAASVDAQTDWEKAYKGLQPKLEERTNQLRTLEEQMSQLQAQLNTLTGTASDKDTQVTQLTQTTQQLEQQAAAATAQAELFRLVATEYPELSPMVGNLKPLNTAEATKQMLEGLRTAVRGAAQAQAQQAIGAYNMSSGNAARGVSDELSIEELRTKVIQAAGTPEYAQLSARYYALIEKTGDYPKPLPDPLADFYN